MGQDWVGREQNEGSGEGARMDSTGGFEFPSRVLSHCPTFPSPPPSPVLPCSLPFLKDVKEQTIYFLTIPAWWDNILMLTRASAWWDSVLMLTSVSAWWDSVLMLTRMSAWWDSVLMLTSASAWWDSVLMLTRASAWLDRLDVNQSIRMVR